MQRHDVASTLSRRCINVMCLLGTDTQKVLFCYWFLNKIENLHFPIVKMPSDYANIDRVGGLNVGFQQVPLVQNFLKFFSVVMEHQ